MTASIGGLLVGAPLIGWLSDRVLERRRLPLVAVSALNVVAWLPLTLPAFAWALRREYRVTYRSGLGPSERLLSGTWRPRVRSHDQSNQIR